jgi:2-hydroxy-6-oxonona-2,4-dienedioate hydrolase
MPTIRAHGATLHYEILGDEGSWVVVMSGGRHPIGEVESLARAMSHNGCRVLLYDRRNCGQSSIHVDFEEPEEDVWVDDLHGLLDGLDIEEAFIVGKSRSARVALRFALRYPDRTAGLGLWGISGGPLAVRFLDDYYYGKYLRACEQGGMEAVCALDHFAGLAAVRPENQTVLLALNPQHFLEVMGRWRAQFLEHAQAPVMGFDDDELRRVQVPTAIVPHYDRMHPIESAIHANKMIPRSRLFDYGPSHHDGPRKSPARPRKSRARRGLSYAHRVLEKNLNRGENPMVTPAAVIPDDLKVAQILCRFQDGSAK